MRRSDLPHSSTSRASVAIPHSAFSLAPRQHLLEQVSALHCGINNLLWFSLFLTLDGDRYISSGSGDGNLYGIAAVCVVYYPIAFFLWVYGPLSMASSLLYHTTVALVRRTPHTKNVHSLNSGNRVLLGVSPRVRR